VRADISVRPHPYLIANPLTRNPAMRIPKTPCPIAGLVPFWNGIYPIISKKPHPVLLWLYTIHAKATDQALVIHYYVSQADIVKEIELFCKFKVGDTVQLGPFNRRSILGRKWDFRTGTMIYVLEGNRAGRDLPMEQEELVRRIFLTAAGSSAVDPAFPVFAPLPVLPPVHRPQQAILL